MEHFETLFLPVGQWSAEERGDRVLYLPCLHERPISVQEGHACEAMQTTLSFQLCHVWQ